MLFVFLAVVAAFYVGGVISQLAVWRDLGDALLWPLDVVYLFWNDLDFFG